MPMDFLIKDEDDNEEYEENVPTMLSLDEDETEYTLYIKKGTKLTLDKKDVIKDLLKSRNEDKIAVKIEGSANLGYISKCNISILIDLLGLDSIYIVDKNNNRYEDHLLYALWDWTV